ncbi:hemerythrin domain-containing protein [Streptomyces sp. MP131-18]|uniref:hemerythrin domain-containing protein n=1 Tax=Streptomyces sp. MP131-18 TaxID=1857892 RepID=UPI00097CC06C|nr:hemerythrin domain-containing protein [Streptomyces sp. MP131-18]ONK15650.1 hypothetical protein STBA_64840 [Streptomyces sp. MP131-18]
MSAPAGPDDRLIAFGRELIAIHRWLRADLRRLRRDTEAHLDGRTTRRPRELAAHCLSFCAALTAHHEGEDRGAFPELAAEFPELRPVIAKLVEDHQMVSEIQGNLERLLGGISERPDEAEARRVRGELDGLSALLDSHFAFEERRIAAALDRLSPAAGTVEELLGIRVGDTG